MGMTASTVRLRISSDSVCFICFHDSASDTLACAGLKEKRAGLPHRVGVTLRTGAYAVFRSVCFFHHWAMTYMYSYLQGKVVRLRA